MAKLTLQEQMLKAGLVNEKKLKKAKKGSKKSRVQAREVKAAVEENKRQQLERDKQLSEQQNAERLNKEIKAQINQLIEMNKVDLKDGDIKYNFTHGTLVKCMTNVNGLKKLREHMSNASSVRLDSRGFGDFRNTCADSYPTLEMATL